MITIQDLSFCYGKKTVFKNLSVSFNAGGIYGLLGRNGTGKSTLLRNICGLLFPKSGVVKVLDYQPAKRLPSFLQNVFLLPEEFDLPNIAIAKFVQLNSPFYPSFNKEQLLQYLEDFEVPQEQSLLNMSYGQKKKFYIAFALACNTNVLLMDEPTNGLDILSKSQFRKVIASAVSEEKCIIISTHQVKDLESLIDRITVIDEQGILFNENINDIAKKLSFKMSDNEQEINEAIYSEKSLRGSAVVVKNTTQEESKIDFELLYKAIAMNTNTIHSIFNHH